MKEQKDDHDQLFNRYYLLRTLLVGLTVSLLSLLFHYFLGVTIFPYRSLTHALERKYVFLVCNGILAFLVKTSAVSSEDSITVSDEPIIRDREETSVVEHEEESGLSKTPEEEEVLSTEELNRKVEEFIRKMKEEIRSEAQHQPIAV